MLRLSRPNVQAQLQRQPDRRDFGSALICILLFTITLAKPVAKSYLKVEKFDVTSRVYSGLCPPDVDNAHGWFSERVSVSRFFLGRLPLPLSAAPPGGPPFLAPFFAAPESKFRAAHAFQIQEMHHGKETLLWQSEL
jgi:hypothetical protein